MTMKTKLELTETAIEELASLLDDYRSLDLQFDLVIELLDNARLMKCPILLVIKE